MIQALLLLASVLGASVYYWQHNKEWSYVQTLDSVNRNDIIQPKYDPHPMLYNYCPWPILQPDEPDIQKYLKRRKRRLACRPSTDLEVEWEDGHLMLTIKSNNSMSCVATDLATIGETPAIRLEPDVKLEIPYTNFFVECKELNGRSLYRKSFFNYHKEQATINFEPMESTPTSPSIAVLFFKSISHAQLQREFPKSLRSSRRFGFFEFSMFNKMSDNITDIVNGTFYHKEVRHTVGQYMRNERYCKVFTNTIRTGIKSDYDLSHWMRSLATDSCSDENSVAERLIEEWARFSIENTERCYLSHIFVNNTIWSKSLDDTLSNVLEQFELNEIFKKTLVVVVSAEGIPVGQFGNSYTGKVEERNPILLAHVPDKLRKIYPDHIFHMEQNQNKLITHQDVFDLFYSFARLSKDQAIVVADEEFMDWKKEHKRGISLWQTLVPDNRTCYHANIPDEFCLCMENKIEVEKAYNQTYEMAARLYEKMDVEILANSSCIQETTWVAEKNYTQVFNLNEKLLNETDEYVDFFYFTVRAYAKKSNMRKNFYVNVVGQFKHNLKDDYDIKQSYPYVTDGTKSWCMAGYMDRFCEMCHTHFFMS
ncbi:unnamed protein product [Caenorhabditis sp. 36 PRJEB53466]|nr:unnamed protein product [Caenorhabditis sp. 36 PRJEB53466]